MKRMIVLIGALLVAPLLGYGAPVSAISENDGDGISTIAPTVMSSATRKSMNTAQVSVKVYPLSRVSRSSPNSAINKNNIMTGLRGGQVPSDRNANPAAWYQVSTLEPGDAITTSFHSWRGDSNPSGLFAGEFGNMIGWAVVIESTNGIAFSAQDVFYETTSSFTALNLSGKMAANSATGTEIPYQFILQGRFDGAAGAVWYNSDTVPVASSTKVHALYYLGITSGFNANTFAELTADKNAVLDPGFFLSCRYSLRFSDGSLGGTGQVTLKTTPTPVPAPVGPAITAHPTSTTVTTGSTVIFTVSATGANLAYQWQKDGVDIAGAIGGTFAIYNVQLGNAGDYRAIVSSTSGTATSVSATLGVVNPSPVPTAHIRGDINGDGRPDLLFQDSNGFLAAWFMNGTSLMSATYLNPVSVSAGYRIVGSGDFNGDGKEDLLFEHTDGTLAVWFMNGTDRIGGASINPANPGDMNWKVVGVADMNNDGNTDIVFQHADGTVGVWFMNGVNRTFARVITPSPGDRNWRVVALGDFNTDGKLDLLFQHTDGTLAVWFMNGTNFSSASLLTPSNPGDVNWKVVGALDVNADGKPDLLFQHTDKTIAAWYMNGIALGTAHYFSPANPGASWRVVGPK